VGLKSLKSLNLTNGYPNNKNNNNNNNKVKSKPLELFELAGKKYEILKTIKICYIMQNSFATQGSRIQFVDTSKLLILDPYLTCIHNCLNFY
jgi:hypothetical protein